MKHDAIVIGGGPAGVAAAIEVARADCDVLLIDRGVMGGEGAFSEEVRFFALRELALRRRRLAQWWSEERGALDLPPSFDRDSAFGRCEAIARGRLARLRRRASALGVRWMQGAARLEGPNAVRVDEGEVRSARFIVIATGSRPRRPTRFAFDGDVICDADSVLRRRRLPRSMVVIGGDLLGCEFSSLFCALGAEVTLVDRRSRLLRYVDRELLGVLHDRLQALGVDLVLEEEVRSVEIVRGSAEPHALVELGSGRRETVECVLVLAGRLPDTSGLGLERTGIRRDAQGAIAVDEQFRSSVESVLAVGGAAGTTSRSGESVREAAIAIAGALGNERPDDSTPIVVHLGVPEFAMAGLTEEASRLLGARPAVGTAEFEESLAGRLRGEPLDRVKLVVAGDRRLCGIHAIGDGAIELVQLGAALIERGTRVDELAAGRFAETSLSVLLRWAAIDALVRMPRASRSVSPENAPRVSTDQF